MRAARRCGCQRATHLPPQYQWCARVRAISDAQTVQVKEVLRVSCSGSSLERCGTSERRMSVYRILILVCTRAHIELPLPCPEDVRYGRPGRAPCETKLPSTAVLPVRG